MGDSVFGSLLFRAARPGRPEADQFGGLPVEQSEVDAGEARDPVRAPWATGWLCLVCV